jgi:hypothetical protein
VGILLVAGGSLAAAPSLPPPPSVNKPGGFAGCRDIDAVGDFAEWRHNTALFFPRAKLELRVRQGTVLENKGLRQEIPVGYVKGPF